MDGVLPMGHEWIAGLPPEVRPLRLAMQYPRLVNLIALEWNNPPIAGTLLTEVLNHDRGNRAASPRWFSPNCGNCTITTSKWLSRNGRLSGVRGDRRWRKLGLGTDKNLRKPSGADGVRRRDVTR